LKIVNVMPSSPSTNASNAGPRAAPASTAASRDARPSPKRIDHEQRARE
jgi:hypothetical protein